MTVNCYDILRRVRAPQVVVFLVVGNLNFRPIGDIQLVGSGNLASVPERRPVNYRATIILHIDTIAKIDATILELVTDGVSRSQPTHYGIIYDRIGGAQEPPSRALKLGHIPQINLLN